MVDVMIPACSDAPFSLLRGSGLKLRSLWSSKAKSRSPSYEGVDWNFVPFAVFTADNCSPSYEGVDWNVLGLFIMLFIFTVLPFTREWIEITRIFPLPQQGSKVLPLTREWIEMFEFLVALGVDMFSLLRGSGLKYKIFWKPQIHKNVLPLTREWIEISLSVRTVSL